MEGNEVLFWLKPHKFIHTDYTFTQLYLHITYINLMISRFELQYYYFSSLGPTKQNNSVPGLDVIVPHWCERRLTVAVYSPNIPLTFI